MFEYVMELAAKLFKDVEWRNLVGRAWNTFWEAFAIVFVLPLDALDLSAWETTLAAGAAAGLSAVKTFIVAFFKARANL